MTDRSLCREPAWRAPLAFLLVFALCLFLYSTLITTGKFIDEMDVFLGGDTVARGGDVYKVFLSQHMPVSYYMAALVALFHPVTVYQFRFGFYILLALLWAGLYVRHRRSLSRFTLLLLPVMYLAQLPAYLNGATMISDHWQGMGLAIVLLELLRYRASRRVTLAAALWIALGILLSFGTAFVSAYSLLMIALGVGLDQLLYAKLGETDTAPGADGPTAVLRRDPVSGHEALREDLRLALICLAPFAALLLWYALSDNLANFIEGAYTVNRTVYTNYIGGFGTSALGAFTGCFAEFAKTMIFSLRDVFSGSDTALVSGYFLLEAFSILLVSTSLILHRRPALGLAWLTACILAGIRGFNHYHGLAFICVGTLSQAVVIGALLGRVVRGGKALPVRALCCLVAVLLILPSAIGLPTQVQEIAGLRAQLEPETEFTDAVELIHQVTDENTPLHITAVTDYMLPIEANHRLDYGVASGTPWMWEAYGAREIAAIEAARTPLVYYEEGTVLDGWDYAMDDYAADLAAYIQANYTPWEAGLWTRNDRRDELNQYRLRAYPYLMSNIIQDEYPDTDEPLTADTPLLQRFVAERESCLAVLLMLGAPDGQPTAGLTVELLDEATGNVLTSGHLDAADIRVSEEGHLVYTAVPVAPVTLTPGHPYALRLTADEADPDAPAIYPYLSWENVDETTCAVMDEEMLDYNVMFMVGYQER